MLSQPCQQGCGNLVFETVCSLKPSWKQECTTLLRPSDQLVNFVKPCALDPIAVPYMHYIVIAICSLIVKLIITNNKMRVNEC